MREDDRWTAIYAAAYVAAWRHEPGIDGAAARRCRRAAEWVADMELSTRSDFPEPKEGAL